MRFGVTADDSSSSESETVVLPSSPPLARRSPLRQSSRQLSRSTVTTNQSKQAYSPTPVQFVQAPKPSRAAKQFKSRIVPLSDDDDDSSFEDDRDGLDEDTFGLGSDSDSDSEEDQWPVGPVGSVGVRGWRTRTSLGSNRVYGTADSFEQWDEQAKQTSWAQANRSFHLSLARSMSASPASSRNDKTFDDVTSIQSLLSNLKLQQQSEQTKLVSSFEQRNKALWSSIEKAIDEAEREEGERQRVLEEKKKQQVEAERKAKEMREAELKKAEEERKRNEEQQAAKAKQEAEERRAREAVEKEQRETREQQQRTASIVAPPTGSSVEGSPQAEFEKWTAVMQQIKQDVLPKVSQNPDWRKRCFTAKRSITPKIGQLTASSETTTRIINQLDQILASMRSPESSGGPTEPYTWTLNHLAKSLVKQAETEVTAKLSTAYPLGRVVIGLLTRGHVELGQVLMARLVKKCFWLTGWFPTKRPDETEQQHRKTLGHANLEAGESLVQYAQRMSGIVALYASIVQTSPLAEPQGPCPVDLVKNVPIHFRPSAGWRWLVLILRPPLVRLEPIPLLVMTFLEVAAEGLGQTYGRQFDKFLEVLLREGLRENKAGFSDKAKSSTVRLTLWLEEWEKKGKIEGTSGRVPDP
ncbi:Nuclear pore complex nucleoporin component [Microbotryomycetes sp. JL221]|nr:Nuclear pore complex nucleoporin component [Microbotryomycetes sp. JL221]